MIFTKAKLDGVLVVEPRAFADRRGAFLEFYNRREFTAAGITCDFVQDNESISAKGVLRGLHYQAPPAEQAKLVRVAAGEIWDVVVDLRRDSPTFGRWLGETLSAENRRMLFIPPGFAHGYLALTPATRVQYKVSQFYSPAHERGILWNDPALAIRWPDAGVALTISERDQSHPGFEEALSARGG